MNWPKPSPRPIETLLFLFICSDPDEHIYEHIFGPNEGYCVYYPSNILATHGKNLRTAYDNNELSPLRKRRFLAFSAYKQPIPDFAFKFS